MGSVLYNEIPINYIGKRIYLSDLVAALGIDADFVSEYVNNRFNNYSNSEQLTYHPLNGMNVRLISLYATVYILSVMKSLDRHRQDADSFIESNVLEKMRSEYNKQKVKELVAIHMTNFNETSLLKLENKLCDFNNSYISYNDPTDDSLYDAPLSFATIKMLPYSPILFSEGLNLAVFRAPLLQTDKEAIENSCATESFHPVFVYAKNNETRILGVVARLLRKSTAC